MSFGHGESIAAWAATRRSRAPRAANGYAPRGRRRQGFAAGDAVTVAAADYAHDDIAGTIVGLDGEEVVIARTDERAGLVHVHFPRIGFHIKAVKKDNP